jgi:kumamolisin
VLHSSRRKLRASAAALSVLGLVATGTSVTVSPAAAAEPLTQLGSNVAPALAHSDRVAELDPSQQVDVQLALNLRDQAGLQDLIRRVSTPGSPDYGHYLTPQHFAARFGPTQQQVNSAVAYLRSNGLTVTSSASGGTLVNAIGSAGQVSSAMHTSLGRYRDRTDGREFYANGSAPALPSNLASIVQAVHGLDNHAVRHSAAVPNACCAGAPYSPTQIRTSYNFTSAPLAGLPGTGQTMGLLELNQFQQSNVNAFDTQYTLSPPSPHVLTVPGGPVLNTNPGEVEVELDIEVMQGIAPAANIMVFEAPNTNTGVNNAYGCMADPNYLGAFGCPNYVSQATAPANSTSWGLCEHDQGASETQTLDNIFQTAAATGHSFYAASGDLGTNDSCTVTPAVDSPASDPNVTGTGGTKLFLNQNTNTWNSETAWPAEPQNNLGGGGGLSTMFTRPSWQVGPGVLNGFSNGNRQVPDVALNSDPVTGFSIYTCAQNTDCAFPAHTGLFPIGGTSAAAPAWAAFTAIYNQYAATQTKPNLGFANPTLYAVNRCTTSPFHDITSGSNVNNNPFSITPGWDYLTGLGSFDSASMASKLVNLATLCPVDPWQSSVVAAPATVVADGATTSTVTVTLRNLANNPVSGKAVTLAKSAGPGAPVVTGPAPATTGANGQTTFTVKSTTAGADTFQTTDTTDSSLAINQTASVTFTGGAVNAAHSTVSASPGTVASDGITPSTITVTLKDINDNPVGGKVVALARSAGPGNPVITGPAPATTGATGQTTFTVKSTTVGSDTFQATDTTDSVVVSQTANVSFTPPPEIVAAVGGDNTPYYQQNLSGWTSLGGGLLAAPAVVSVPSPSGGVGAPIYLGLGGNHDLYVRTATQGWQPLDDLPVYCIDNPGATIIGSTLTIACQGGDHGLYRVQGPVPAQGVPPFFSRNSWQALGGVLTAGPAVANVPGRGLDIMVVGGSNHVYEYYGGSYHANGFLCSGHTALATIPGQTLTYFGCHGLDNSLWWAQNDGGNWFGAASLGGQIIDGPAIAATNQGPTFFVEGLDHGLLHRGLSGGYTYDGGYIQYGTAAAAIF